MAKEAKKSTGRTRQREYRTKELSLKQRVANYIRENPEASKKSIADHFKISTKELSIVLGKIKTKVTEKMLESES